MLIKKLRFPYKLDPTNSIQFILRQSTGKKTKDPSYYGDFENQFRSRILVKILVSLLCVFQILRKKIRFFSSISLSDRGI